MDKVGPDFLCIGMAKAGTGWLYDALCEIDGFAMLPIKEFRHFGFASVINKGGNSFLKKNMLAKRLYHQMDIRRSRQSKRELAGLKKAVDAYVKSDFSDSTYLDLFSSHRAGWFSERNNDINGDMSTDYSLLEQKEIEHIHSILPNIPVMMIVRNPVDRLWSAFNMNLRRRGRKTGDQTPEDFHKEIDGMATIEVLEQFCNRAPVLRSSEPSRTYLDWSKFYNDIHVISFDDIRRDPRNVIAKAASFAEGKPISLPEGFELENSKERLAKTKMLPGHRAFLYSHLSDELQRCKEVFPNIAANWAFK